MGKLMPNDEQIIKQNEKQRKILFCVHFSHRH